MLVLLPKLLFHLPKVLHHAVLVHFVLTFIEREEIAQAFQPGTNLLDGPLGGVVLDLLTAAAAWMR